MQTMEKHTPGPWRIEATQGGRVTIISAGFDGDGPSSYVVAASGIDKPDAILIAAAPLMLQALKEAKLALDAHALRRCKWTSQNQDAYELIQAAIIQAETIA